MLAFAALLAPAQLPSTLQLVLAGLVALVVLTGFGVLSYLSRGK